VTLPARWIVENAGLFRGLLFLFLLVGARLLSKRPRLALPVAAAFVTLACGLWVLALARPYGLLIDSGVTQRIAAASIAEQEGAGGLLGGAPAAGGLVAALSSQGVPASLLSFLFTAAPVLAALVFLWLLVLSVREIEDQAILAVAASVFLFTDLDLLAGSALPALAWASPRGALIALLSVAVFTLTRRLGSRLSVSMLAPAAVLVAGLLFQRPFGYASRQWLEALGSLLPLILLSLAAAGSDRRALQSGVVTFCAALGIALVGGGMHGFAAARGALLVAALPGFRRLVAALDDLAAELAPGPHLGGLGAFFLLIAPATAPFWWRPPAIDRVTEDSLEPVSATLVAEMRALAAATKPGDVIVASPEMAPYVMVFAGRRVLRAPTLVTPPDDADRQAAEFTILRGRARPRLLARFGVTHLLAAPGDFTDRGVPDPESLAAHPGFSLVREGAARIRLYRVGGSDPGGP